MSEEILSAGIDIGTTTTQVIFSRLLLEQTGGFGTVPRIHVRKRDIFYRSEILWTPLYTDRQTGEERIDGSQTAALIRKEYRRAGIRPEMLGTGAVIITGETARKRNAREITEQIASLAGDFVVAAAGPELESFLAGKGAGADVLSRKTGKHVLNIDIGGGTSNLCFFQEGKEADDVCADIGGRLIRLDGARRITYISPKLGRLLSSLDLALDVGSELTEKTGKQICQVLASLLAEIANLKPMSQLGTCFLTNHRLKPDSKADILCFSGGVADCMDEQADENYFRYGDIGPLLGQAVRKEPAFTRLPHFAARETVRATVIGAGAYSMEVSGSTITCEGICFPMKNLKVRKLPYESREDMQQFLEACKAVLEGTADGINFALAVKGPRAPSFQEIEAMAEALYPIMERYHSVPVILENDFAKALGQALRRRLGKNAPVICLDGIACSYGEYIDIGKPVGGGMAVPVIVKTLVFS